MAALRDTLMGRDWLRHPPGEARLFRNRLVDSFGKSPPAGLDESIPTIGPGIWRGHDGPDHGEIWSLPWWVKWVLTK